MCIFVSGRATGLKKNICSFIADFSKYLAHVHHLTNQYKRNSWIMHQTKISGHN